MKCELKREEAELVLDGEVADEPEWIAVLVSGLDEGAVDVDGDLSGEVRVVVHVEVHMEAEEVDSGDDVVVGVEDDEEDLDDTSDASDDSSLQTS